MPDYVRLTIDTEKVWLRALRYWGHGSEIEMWRRQQLERLLDLIGPRAPVRIGHA